MNIRVKLSIQFTAIVLTILVLFSMAIYYFSANFRMNDFNTRLEEKALTTAKLLIEVQEVDSVLLKIIDNNSINLLEDEKITVYNNSNKLIFKTSDKSTEIVDPEILNKVKKEKKIYYGENKYDCVGLVFRFEDNEYVVLASAYDKYGYKELHNLKIILVIGLLCSFLLTFFAGLFFAGRAMSPILDVIKQVNNINPLRLDARVDEGNRKDEIAQIAITFNRMLERVELAFENQRQFVSNVSHELRTPLTSLTGQLEVTLMKERSISEYETLLKSMLEDIKTLNSLSNGLLELAHSNIEIHAFESKSIRVDEILIAAQTDLLKRHNDYKIEICFEEMPDDDQKLIVCANENLLKIAFLNIMDNACKFSLEKRLDVSIMFRVGFLDVKFSDKGMGIPENEIENIFEPFYRARNSSKKQGHGIGLSLVKRVIEMHNGALCINSQINKGTQITISLPS